MSELLFASLLQTNPSLQSHVTSLTSLKSQKLYFQLTSAIENFLAVPSLTSEAFLAEFYFTFISDIQAKINPLKLVKIVGTIIGRFVSFDKALELLQNIEDTVEFDIEARSLLYITQADVVLKNARNIQANGEIILEKVDESQQKLELVKELLVGIDGINAHVKAEYFKVWMNIYEIKGNPNQYFEHAVLYLNYTEMDQFDLVEQLELLKKLMISSLVGDKVFNYADLLNSPLCDLVRDEYAKLPINKVEHCCQKYGDMIVNELNQRFEMIKNMYKLISSLNSGDMKSFLAMQPIMKQLFVIEPSIQMFENKIYQKASIISLMELVFKTISTKRVFSFDKLAEVTCINVNMIELLVMKAFNLELLKGVIDQLKSEVIFTWVKPRTLDKNQVMFVKEKLDEWESMTKTTLELVDLQK